MDIRLLRADEIDIRVQSVKEKGFVLLLYKDARVDMNILDEVFGVYGWQRKHEIIDGNLYCTISIYDKETGQWINKQDVGTESNTEKEKGQASDSFKRSAFNIGIGRELYTSPFIWISDTKYINNNKVYTKFKVSQIAYNEHREIINLVIVDDKGKQVYRLGEVVEPQKPKEIIPQEQPKETPKADTISTGQQKRLFAISKGNNDLVKEALALKGLTSSSQVKKADYESICKYIEEVVKANEEGFTETDEPTPF